MNLKTRAASLFYKAASYLSPISSSRSWWPSVLESFAGAWQQNVVVNKQTVSENWAVFACVTLIAGDIAKMPARVWQYSEKLKIYEVTRLRQVLQRPNRYQTAIDFFKSWVFSLLLNGNTYVLKQRDEKGFIVALYILDPCRVKPLIAEDGGIYYALSDDNLSGLGESITVPASEIIHDRLYTLWHPLVGVSPIYACGVAAMQGAAIQDNSAKFFQNMSRPSGILTAPGAIGNDTAARLKASWEENFTGSNIGKVAILGDGLKYEAMTITATDAQLIEQLKFTGEMICACFHIPPYKLGLGAMPTVNNTSMLNQQYYDQAIQPITENMEQRLDIGLELQYPYETWLNEEALLRMDQASRITSHAAAIGGGFMAPNEARQKENMAPVDGGETPYLQVQNYSLAALSKRDSKSEDGSTNIQAQAMNGAQVVSLQGLIVAASSGEIPPEAARAAILAAFPLLDPSQVDAMINPLDGFEPTAPTTPTDTTPPADQTPTAAKAMDSSEFDKALALAMSEPLTIRKVA